MPDAVAGGARMVTMPVRPLVRRALAVLTLAGASLALALPAAAHAELVDSDPADGSALTSLESVRLEFSEELLDIGNSITITDGADVSHELEVTVEGTTLEAPVVEPVAPGDVTIAWRNASVDGHTEEGELHVTLEAAPSPSPSPSASQPLSPSATASAPSPSPSLSVMPVAGEGGPSPWLWGILGLVVIGGAAAAIIAATRRPPYED